MTLKLYFPASSPKLGPMTDEVRKAQDEFLEWLRSSDYSECHCVIQPRQTFSTRVVKGRIIHVECCREIKTVGKSHE